MRISEQQKRIDSEAAAIIAEAITLDRCARALNDPETQRVIEFLKRGGCGPTGRCPVHDRLVMLWARMHPRKPKAEPAKNSSTKLRWPQRRRRATKPTPSFKDWLKNEE